MNKQIKIAIQWGIIGGLCMAIFRYLIYLISPLSVSDWDNVYYMPLLFCMVWGVITAKRETGGFITFGQAFTVVFIIAMIGAAINTLFAFALIKIIDPALEDKLYQHGMEKAEAKWEKANLSEEQIRAYKEKAESFFKSKYFIAYIILIQVVIGTILSLIIAAFARRPNNRPDTPVENSTDTNPTT